MTTVTRNRCTAYLQDTDTSRKSRHSTAKAQSVNPTLTLQRHDRWTLGLQSKATKTLKLEAVSENIFYEVLAKNLDTQR